MRGITVIAGLGALLLAGGAAADDIAPGEKLAIYACGRCHVVSERNRYGGIGSTPSFAAMRNLPDWEARFRAFYTLNPHPAFTQVTGITEPFPEHRPSPIAPIEVTEDEIARIVEFARGVTPKDLGAPLKY